MDNNYIRKSRLDLLEGELLAMRNCSCDLGYGCKCGTRLDMAIELVRRMKEAEEGKRA